MFLGKSTSKNEYLMNLGYGTRGNFLPDFEHGVSEWQASEVEQIEYEHTSYDGSVFMV